MVGLRLCKITTLALLIIWRCLAHILYIDESFRSLCKRVQNLVAINEVDAVALGYVLTTSINYFRARSIISGSAAQCLPSPQNERNRS